MSGPQRRHMERHLQFAFFSNLSENCTLESYFCIDGADIVYQCLSLKVGYISNGMF